MFPAELQNGLWHTTNRERYAKIIALKAILPNPPDMPDSERWGSSDNPPFVRSLGGISLFEFNNFDPERYATTHPASSWQHFIPYKRSWGISVWIEIDRSQIEKEFLNAEVVADKWNINCKGNLMPRIEAACLGPIPLQAFQRVLTFGEKQPYFIPQNYRNISTGD